MSSYYSCNRLQQSCNRLILLLVCPHTTIYVPSYNMLVLILPDASSYYTCPHIPRYVSSYYGSSPVLILLILLYIVFSYLCILVLQGTDDVVRVMMLLYYYIRVMMLLYYYMRILILLYICVLVLLCICMHIRCARRG